MMIGSEWFYWLVWAISVGVLAAVVANVVRDRKIDRYLTELDRKRRRDEWRAEWPDLPPGGLRRFMLERSTDTFTHANLELAEVVGGDGR